MLPQPVGVVIQVGLPHVPAGLHENGLEGVHRNVVVCSMATGMHQIIAAPVLRIPPVCASPVFGHQGGYVVPGREQGCGQAVLALDDNAVVPGAKLALPQPEDSCLICQLQACIRSIRI